VQLFALALVCFDVSSKVLLDLALMFPEWTANFEFATEG
jgi:hypothetical protein